jgi:hypothetical protein
MNERRSIAQGGKSLKRLNEPQRGRIIKALEQEALIMSELRKEVLECIDRIPDSKLEGPCVPFCVC